MTTHYTSSWQKIKREYLIHFSRPRLDLLCWILIRKLLPLYYRKGSTMFGPVARYRELPSWRKDFKREWRRCEKTAVTDPEDPTYAPDPIRWTCTCKAFSRSRFLICKHVVQSCHTVPGIFFLQVKRARTTPFWRHPELRPLDGTITEASAETADSETSDSPDDPFADVPCDAENDWEDVFGDHKPVRENSHEEMLRISDLLREFSDAIKFQASFNDRRCLGTLNRYGGQLFGLASDFLEHERKSNSTRCPNPTTWDPLTSHLMFFRTRPPKTTSPSHQN
jgi:hypothetical protein